MANARRVLYQVKSTQPHKQRDMGTEILVPGRTLHRYTWISESFTHPHPVPPLCSSPCNTNHKNDSRAHRLVALLTAPKILIGRLLKEVAQTDQESGMKDKDNPQSASNSDPLTSGLLRSHHQELWYRDPRSRSETRAARSIFPGCREEGSGLRSGGRRTRWISPLHRAVRSPSVAGRVYRSCCLPG